MRDTPPAKAGGPDVRKADVPVKAVVLFSSGVGYFEHFGTVKDNGARNSVLVGPGVHVLPSGQQGPDGTTPIGSYGFASTVYGVAANPGVRFRYHRLVCGDWWDEDPASPTYNTFEHLRCGAIPPFRGDSEALWRQTRAYRFFAVIDYNVHPVVHGRGSANGCVSLPAARLVRLLSWLAPSAAPRMAIRIAGG